MMRPRAKRTKIWAIHMPNMAEKAKQELEVGSAKQKVRSYLGNRGYIYSINMPNMTEKAEQEVGFAKQEVESYLGTVFCRAKRMKIWALLAT